MKIYGKTDIGRVRELNEDSFVFGNLTEKAAYIAVCDGMGGANHGEVASEMATDRIKDNFQSKYKDEYTDSNTKNLIITTLNLANADIYDKSRIYPEYTGMGTTVCLSIIKNNGDFVVGNIGDSRAYIVGDTVRQISEDHSLVWDLLKKGEISKEDMENHPDKNVITRALGVENKVDADIYFDTFSNGETLLICSDGLSGYVSEEDIIQCCKNSLEDAAERLVEKANEAGGKDNITVVLCRL